MNERAVRSLCRGMIGLTLLGALAAVARVLERWVSIPSGLSVVLLVLVWMSAIVPPSLFALLQSHAAVRGVVRVWDGSSEDGWSICLSLCLLCGALMQLAPAPGLGTMVISGVLVSFTAVILLIRQRQVRRSSREVLPG